jgi:hypothetical protein
MAEQEPQVAFALLAPVPQGHLKSAMDRLKQRADVAFGSMKFELFHELDNSPKFRNGGKVLVPTLIYSSHERDPGHPSYMVKWGAWYVGLVNHKSGCPGEHPDGPEARPESTLKTDVNDKWAVFWHVQGLKELDAPRRISGLRRYKSGRDWSNAPPRGPELITCPNWFSGAMSASHE